MPELTIQIPVKVRYDETVTGETAKVGAVAMITEAVLEYSQSRELGRSDCIAEPNGMVDDTIVVDVVGL